MYHDFRGTNRDSWKFTYTGSQMLEHAKNKLDQYTKEEMDSRNELADLMRDPNVSHNDVRFLIQRVSKLKKNIEFSGTQREACMVYVHEFKRNLQREYHLSLGDVTYFGLHNNDPE